MKGCEKEINEECLPEDCVVSAKWTCADCGEYRYEDGRVDGGLKCGHCAYGVSSNYLIGLFPPYFF